MLPKEFTKRQHEFQSEPVLFFIPTSIDDGSEVVQSYSRQECIDACIHALPLSHFAELWNNGSVEETPDVRDTWCCVSMPTVYDACQGEKKREISELKEALSRFGGEAHFGLDYCGPQATGTDCPIVTARLKYTGPADIRILAAKVEDDTLTILGQQVFDGFDAGSYDNETQEIPVANINLSELRYITEQIPQKTKH